MYISLKDGWLPLSDLCLKYGKDKGNMNKILENIIDKEKIGNAWVVRESEFIENIKTDKTLEIDDIDKLNEIVDKFTTELSKKLDVNTIKTKFMIEHVTTGDYILKTILEWAIKCQINFPIEIYTYMGKNELYTKCLLVQQIWNKVLRNSKVK